MSELKPNNYNINDIVNVNEEPKKEDKVKEPVKKEEKQDIVKENSSTETEMVLKTTAFDSLKQKKKKKVLKGFYLEPEVSKGIDKISKKIGTRGAQSEFVNQVLKDVLKANGYL